MKRPPVKTKITYMPKNVQASLECALGLLLIARRINDLGHDELPSHANPADTLWELSRDLAGGAVSDWLYEIEKGIVKKGGAS